jgi:hypothetical protein
VRKTGYDYETTDYDQEHEHEQEQDALYRRALTRRYAPHFPRGRGKR